MHSLVTVNVATLWYYCYYYYYFYLQTAGPPEVRQPEAARNHGSVRRTSWRLVGA